MGPARLERSSVKRFAQKGTCHCTLPSPETLKRRSPDRPRGCPIFHKHAAPDERMHLRAERHQSAGACWNLMHHYRRRYREDQPAGLPRMIA